MISPLEHEKIFRPKSQVSGNGERVAQNRYKSGTKYPRVCLNINFQNSHDYSVEKLRVWGQSDLKHPAYLAFVQKILIQPVFVQK